MNPLSSKYFKKRLDNSVAREEFVINQLMKLENGLSILDAGCGDQKYRAHCSHLKYYSQDFAQYSRDEKLMLGTNGLGGLTGYEYGNLDFVGDIWNIAVEPGSFDAVLCTEVLEHVPFPIESIGEIARILKPGGKLILTAPSNCLRHMDPYFFSSGFSDRWYERIFPESGLVIEQLVPVGDYYSWMSVEIFRSMRIDKLRSFLLFPAFIYFFLKRKTEVSTDTLCMGYHIVATKIS